MTGTIGVNGTKIIIDEAGDLGFIGSIPDDDRIRQRSSAEGRPLTAVAPNFVQEAKNVLLNVISNLGAKGEIFYREMMQFFFMGDVAKSLCKSWSSLKSKSPEQIAQAFNATRCFEINLAYPRLGIMIACNASIFGPFADGMREDILNGIIARGEATEIEKHELAGILFALNMDRHFSVGGQDEEVLYRSLYAIMERLDEREGKRVVH